MEPEVAAVATCIILSTIYLVISEARRIRTRTRVATRPAHTRSQPTAVAPQRRVRSRHEMVPCADFYMREEDTISFSELREVFPERKSSGGASVNKDT